MTHSRNAKPLKPNSQLLDLASKTHQRTLKNSHSLGYDRVAVCGIMPLMPNKILNNHSGKFFFSIASSENPMSYIWIRANQNIRV